jgi:hypothetical protein
MSAYQFAGRGGSDTDGHFELFDLTVHLGPDDIPWISAASAAGAVYGIPRGEKSLPRLPDLLDLVYDYTDAVLYAEQQSDPELSHVLGQLIFGDPMVLQLFQATRGVAADRGRQVLFRLLASPHLAVLPWELLPDPAAVRDSDGYRYLALAPDTYLVRLARGRFYPTGTALLEAPLNLLIVLSSPTPQRASEDWLSFDIYEVKRALLEELSPLEQDGLLRIDVEDRPTLYNLRRRIGAQRRGYHLFHYVGHALPDRLILEDRAGRRKDVTSSQLVEVLRLCPDLRLAVFAGCETARAARDPESLDTRRAVGWRDLLSLADHCVQEACPAVVGMQAVLPFSAERVFTRFFYQALASGYSTAEALRMARSAIRGDERFGGDLLDWSVPALFVGSTEPGPLVPRSGAASRPTVRLRSELKLGFRQSEERFFARELPLRQAVDVLNGLTPQRVLVITGAMGVGKTSLVDRALEELGKVIRPEEREGAVTHVLYAHFDRLVPQVVQACEALDAGAMPDLDELKRLKPDCVLERLCRLATELLRQGGGTPRAKDDNWSVVEWWERIVEDLVQHRFVLAIDQVGRLDRGQSGLLERLVGHWLEARSAADLETAPKGKLLADLQEELSALQKSRERSEGVPQSMPEQLALVRTELPQEVIKLLNGLPDRLLLESRQVFEHLLERQVAELSYAVALQAASGEPAPDAGDSGDPMVALEATEGVHRSLGEAIVEPAPDAGGSGDLVAALEAIEAVRTSLGEGLRILADRRSPARIVITAAEKPRYFLDLPEDLVFEMRLAQLTWPETWRWIRRNLPALTGFGEDYLSQLWPYLGARLARWEELEGRVLRGLPERGRSVNLHALATEIAPRRPAQPSGAGALTARRGQRALRIAVAGPLLAGPDAVAKAITRLAIEHGIGGQVVLGADEAGALATLIDEPSPFDEKGGTSARKILLWLKHVLAKQPDIVLLDYRRLIPLEWIDESVAVNTEDASPQDRRADTVAEHTMLRSMYYLCLLIAAGGHKEAMPGVPAPCVYPEVLGVGPLDNDGRLRPYAWWHPDLGKPDLFMADDLSRTALATAVQPDRLDFHQRTQTWGSSFSALHAVATAALVWSIMPDLSPHAIWKMLDEASNPIAGMEPARSLRIEDAVALARRRAVQRALRVGPASFQTLGASTGLDARALWTTLDSLLKKEEVIRLTSGRLERFQLLRGRHEMET